MGEVQSRVQRVAFSITVGNEEAVTDLAEPFRFSYNPECDLNTEIRKSLQHVRNRLLLKSNGSRLGSESWTVTLVENGQCWEIRGEYKARKRKGRVDAQRGPPYLKYFFYGVSPPPLPPTARRAERETVCRITVCREPPRIPANDIYHLGIEDTCEIHRKFVFSRYREQERLLRFHRIAAELCPEIRGAVIASREKLLRKHLEKNCNSVIEESWSLHMEREGDIFWIDVKYSGKPARVKASSLVQFPRSSYPAYLEYLVPQQTQHSIIVVRDPPQPLPQPLNPDTYYVSIR